MMDLHKWLRLFEIDPELKPPGLEHNPGGVAAPDDPDGGKTLPVWTISCDGVTIDPEPGDEWKQDEESAPELVSIIPMHTAAALIRDRAVIVGGEKWRFNLVWAGRAYRDDRPDGWQVYYKQKLLVQKPDPLEALYLACCKVLEVEP